MSWEFKTLDELGFVGRGRSRHRPRGDEKLYGGNYPFIQTGDVQKAQFYITDFSLTYSDFGFSQSKLWEKGTLCISIVGANTAESAILDIDACFPDSVIGFVADRKVSNTAFVKYYLDTIKVQMKTISEGAARENLSMDKLLSMKLFVPNVHLQDKIALAKEIALSTSEAKSKVVAVLKSPVDLAVPLSSYLKTAIPFLVK